MIFNSYDKKEKGMISIDEAKKIFEEKAIPIDKCKYIKNIIVDVHYKISIPIESGYLTFDELLFVFALCEDISLDVDHKY
jgi:hypothetical protein